MSKHILIFSDGTGQIGGLHPDQRLSNVYKIYRATRSGPDSKIRPDKQISFYDPGLGAGEVGGLTFKRLRNLLASTIGNGIDENIIDCYAAIIANYQEGDKVCLFGFSRGAYTVRCVANVMNLCGVPTQMPDGSPVPVYGPELRKIASDAVKYIYNHGAGKNRGEYEDERETKARRFRDKYHSNGRGMDGESQGNVQPTFIGVFDTVAALGSRAMQWVALASAVAMGALTVCSIALGWPMWVSVPLSLISLTGIYWLYVVVKSQVKYFKEDPEGRITSWHFAAWNLKNYDKYLDNLVRFARHAISIDEHRKNFPRVGWGASKDAERNKDLKPAWMKQVWFAGNHSDIGGSYPENESRLSDIALQWMIEELKETMPEIKINENLLITNPDPLGLQHDEIQNVRNMWPSFIPKRWRDRMTWPKKVRNVGKGVTLHVSVVERLQSDVVPQMGEIKPYSPENLKDHFQAAEFYKT